MKKNIQVGLLLLLLLAPATTFGAVRAEPGDHLHRLDPVSRLHELPLL